MERRIASLRAACSRRAEHVVKLMGDALAHKEGGRLSSRRTPNSGEPVRIEQQPHTPLP